MSSTLSIKATDHTLGPANAAVTLLEYGDFQCPGCGMAYGIINSLLARFEGHIRFVFRHMPLASVHPYAELAAQAAEAAGAQGKFWLIHAALYENQRHLDPEVIKRLAQSIVPDLATFEDDLISSAFSTRIHEDYQSAVHHGAQGTPTFFINGELYEGEWDERTLSEVLHRLIDASPSL
jgi:protein-disulfide isomerase